jgi:phospholipid transport system substrate-binding protein
MKKRTSPLVWHGAALAPLLFILLGTLPNWVYGADIADAQTLVENTTNQVLDTLKKNKERFQNDKQALYDLVNGIIVPHFDFRLMARLVLGKQWKNSNADQRTRFTDEFTTLLVRTYSTAMLDFTEATIKHLPVRSGGGAQPKALSRMEITQPGGRPPAQMQLRMIDRKGAWMIYDVTIDGVSLVTNYRKSFNQDISEHDIEYLIDKLIDKNRGKSS